MLRALADIPFKVILEPDALPRLGLELAAMGLRKIAVVMDRRTQGFFETLGTSLERANRCVSGVFVCESLARSDVEEASSALSGCDAVVSIGGWLPSSFSMYVCGELRTPLVAVPAPPGLSTPLERVPIPMREMPIGCFRFARPMLAVFDPSVVTSTGVERVMAETATLSAKGLVLGLRNAFASRLALSALQELRQAADQRSVEGLCFAAMLSALANSLLSGSATSALARAVYVLQGIDPTSAELSIFPCWLARALEAGWVVSGRAVNDLRWVLSTLASMSFPSLGELGLQAKRIDLVVEYAWTFEHYSVEADPVVTDKLSLRELLINALRRGAC